MDWVILALALWLGPTIVPGLVLLFTVYRPESYSVSRTGVDTVVRRGRLIGGDWIGGQSFGWFRFYKNRTQRQRKDLVKHETRHTWQALIPGFPLWYGLGFVYQWAKRGFRDWREAYRANWWEADARRAAGQE